MATMRLFRIIVGRHWRCWAVDADAERAKAAAVAFYGPSDDVSVVAWSLDHHYLIPDAPIEPLPPDEPQPGDKPPPGRPNFIRKGGGRAPDGKR